METNIQSLLLDVHGFLNELDKTGLPVKLRRKADELKLKLVSLPQLHVGSTAEQHHEDDDDEQLYDSLDDGPKPGETSPSSGAAGSAGLKRASSAKSWVWVPDEPNIPDMSVEALKGSTYTGSLEKRRPADGSIMKLMNRYQKRYCVIHNGIFYYFDNASSKKQKGAFPLSEYEARPAYRLFKDISKKECSFELVSPGKRPYQFLARSFEEMKEWIAAVARVSSVKHPDMSTILRPSEHEEGKNSSVNGSNMSLAGSDSGSLRNVGEEEYDEAGPSASGSFQLHSPQEAITEEFYDEASAGSQLDDGEQTYDEATVGGTESAPPRTPLRRQPQPPDDDCGPVAPPTPNRKLPPLPPPEETYDDAAAGSKPPARTPQLEDPGEVYDEAGLIPEEDTYDDADVKAEEKLLPSRKGPLPPRPPEQRTVVVHRNDYSNMFYGLWDCQASKDHELTFKAGQIVHVVERKYEESGWLTAVLDGKVGLVPACYLTPAYTAAA